jgi:ring-1,2-phenylacetyl-CoA epoxidase subunit PaaB
MDVWEVFSRRTEDDPLVHVGAVKAPDADLALVLAREAFFRHGEGVDCWITRRGDLHRVTHPETLGGVTDKSYRRQEGYVGVGAKLKRVTKQLAGSRIDRPRPEAKR